MARGKHAPIEPGQGIGGVARLLPPSGPVLPGGYDFGFNSYFQGIGAIGFFYGPPHRGASRREPAAAALLAGFELRWRGFARPSTAASARCCRAKNGALAAALIVADRGGIPEPAVAALRDAGLAHILAISGLHMALVAGTMFFVLRLLLGLSLTATEGLPAKKIAAVAALVVATAYLAISGAAVSTLRAWIMLALILVAVLLDRPALTLRNVAIAAIAIILTNPAAVVGPSFQMSFAATAALIAGYSALRQLPRRPESGTGWRNAAVVRFPVRRRNRLHLARRGLRDRHLRGLSFPPHRDARHAGQSAGNAVDHFPRDADGTARRAAHALRAGGLAARR